VAREVFLQNSLHLLNPIDYATMAGSSMIMEELMEKNLPSVYITCDNSSMISRFNTRARSAEAALRCVCVCL
jgi:hypothetical protein